MTKQPKGKQNKQINSNKLKGSQRGCKEVNQSNEDVNKLQGETAYERLYKIVKDNCNVRNVPKVRSTRSNHSPLRSELPQRQQPQKKNGSPKVFSAVNTNMSRSIAEARPQQLPAEENQLTVSYLVEDIQVTFAQDGMDLDVNASDDDFIEVDSDEPEEISPPAHQCDEDRAHGPSLQISDMDQMTQEQGVDKNAIQMSQIAQP